jgi:WD40 repeat protein/tRNA A-37 threonylcarbamoyl transferase component Bud32
MNPTSGDVLPADPRFGEVLAAYLEAVDNGWAPARRAFLARYPHLRVDLEAFFTSQDQVESMAAQLRTPTDHGHMPPAIEGTLPESDAGTNDAPPDFDDYEVLEEIARGGMGVVFKARQKSLNRIVALKRILSGQLATPAEVQRFRLEAESAALMDHPGIVPIYEVGEHEGQHYFSMKLIEGGNLAQALGSEPWRATSKEAVRRIVDFLAKVARAVHYAHQRGILHRDLKPANILLGERGEPLVTDFGLAKRVQAEASATHSNAIVGTPTYMAPEQAFGKSGGLTTAADVYSLGAILYELLTGRPPFKAENPLDTLLQVRDRKPTPPRALNARVDTDLDTICLKCLEKEPGRRYAGADELADDLDRWAAGEPVRARRAGAWTRMVKWARRSPALAGLVLLSGLVTILAFVGAGVLLQLRATRELKYQAELARDAEAQARQDAVQAREKEQFALYVHRVTRAHYEWLNNDVARADQILEECPVSLRQWEWRYLKRLCHADLLTLTGHTAGVVSVAFSPDGRRLASASGKWDKAGEVKLWNATTGQELRSLQGHTNAVWSVAFSPDGQRLASASLDKTVKVWDAATGQELLTLQGHTSAIWSVAFSPDGRRLASASSDQTVKVWDATTGQVLRTLLGHTDAVWSVAFSPDGQRLASASSDQTVKVWDATTGQELLTLQGHTGVVWSVAFGPDGRRLASAGVDGAVKVWDTTDGQEELTLQGHTSAVTSLVFSPDGRRLASASSDQTVKVWDTAGGQELRTLQGHTDAVRSVALSPDGRRLAASLDKTVKVWDAASGQELLTLKGHTGFVWSVAFSPDGRCLASASLDGMVKVWDATTGQELLTLQGHTSAIWSVAFSPDGRRLASASSDGMVKVWDTATGQEALTLKRHTRAVFSMAFSFSVAFSPDGRRLASAGVDGTVKVWDAASGEEELTLKGHTSAVTSLAFSPDGQRLASAGVDGTVKVWDAQSDQETLTLRAHSGAARSLAFSPDGQRLASACGDQVKVWDATPLSAPRGKPEEPGP